MKVYNISTQFNIRAISWFVTQLMFLAITAPPSPLVGLGGDMTEYSGHHTLPHRLSHQISRSSGANSPPLPPPPPPEQDEHPQFGRPTPSGAIMPIVPDEEDLPGWVPKNYIEKGRTSIFYLILKRLINKLVRKIDNTMVAFIIY